MPEINLPTAAKQDTILANTNAINSNVDIVNTNVNANKSTLATVNANLGTPTSGASSSTGANAHAKLNHLLTKGSGVSNFDWKKISKLGGLVPHTSEAPGAILYSLTGKMLLKNVTIQLQNSNYEGNRQSIYIDGAIFKGTTVMNTTTKLSIDELYVMSTLRIRDAEYSAPTNVIFSYDHCFLF